MVDGIHGAFSLAVAQTFYLGVAGAVIAVLAAVAIKEIPLRATNAAPVATVALGTAAAPHVAGAPSAPAHVNAPIREVKPSLD